MSSSKAKQISLIIHYKYYCNPNSDFSSPFFHTKNSISDSLQVIYIEVLLIVTRDTNFESMGFSWNGFFGGYASESSGKLSEITVHGN